MGRPPGFDWTAGRAFQDQRVFVLHHPFDHFALLDFQGLRQPVSVTLSRRTMKSNKLCLTRILPFCRLPGMHAMSRNGASGEFTREKTETQTQLNKQ